MPSLAVSGRGCWCTVHNFSTMMKTREKENQGEHEKETREDGSVIPQGPLPSGPSVMVMSITVINTLCVGQSRLIPLRIGNNAAGKETGQN